MNNSNGIGLLTTILAGATETRNLEFKEGFNWEAQQSAKMRDELIKAILAMSNTPSGGTIVLGIVTDTKNKKIYPNGFLLKDAESFIKNDEQIKKKVHGFCQRPIEIEIKVEPHPEKKDAWFVILQVVEFDKWPTITISASKTKEDNKRIPVIENKAIYTRSKLAQWSSVKAGPQEIEDIIEIAVKKYDKNIQSLGYNRVAPFEEEINNWFSLHETEALKELKTLQINTYTEVKVKFVTSDLTFEKVELRNAARDATIPTFGWPIAVFLDNQDEYRPAADKGGIKASLPILKHAMDGSKTFDYWAINVSGAFYLLKSIFEDLRKPEIISFNTRIIRTTEVFMYLRNLYRNLGIDSKKEFEISIKYVGIKGRKLGTLAQNRLMLGTYINKEDESLVTVRTSIDSFNKNPIDVIDEITKPLFEQFDFYRVDKKIMEQIVNDYLEGKVT